MVIRKEKPSDIAAIAEVTKAAFEDHPFSQQTEQNIISALREDGALAISLVAEVNGRVVGHISFSPVTISDGTTNWYGLGPVSVLPSYQCRRIGTKLVNTGLALLKSMDGKGCALVGEPTYYNRFGFKNHPELIHEGIPQEVFVAKPLNPTTKHIAFQQLPSAASFDATNMLCDSDIASRQLAQATTPEYDASLAITTGSVL